MTARLDIRLSNDTSICVCSPHFSGEVKVCISKDDIVHGPEKSILRKVQIKLSIDEFEKRMQAIPTINKLLQFCTEQSPLTLTQ